MTLKRPLLMGYRGSIGSRYAAILKHLDCQWTGLEVDEDVPTSFDSVIIATPTAQHLEHVMQFAGRGVPILIEKPLATNLGSVEEACTWLDEQSTPIRMVNQYRYLPSARRNGDTYYNFFRSGRDGKYWDTISLIALARGKVTIRDTSPVWTCALNGDDLTAKAVDRAYVDMIDDFLRKPPTSPETDYIREAHTKVAKMIALHD